MRYLLAAVLATISTSVAAAELELGRTLVAAAPVCLTLEAAKEVATAGEKHGAEAELAALNAHKQCAYVKFAFKPLRVAYRYTMQDGTPALVVEVGDPEGSPGTVFVLTDWTIKGEFNT